MHFLRFYFVTAAAGFNKNLVKYKSVRVANKTYAHTRVKSKKGGGESAHNFE